MKPYRKDCGCTVCSQCKGTGKIIESIDYKTMSATEITCTKCEAKDNFSKCFDHIKHLLDDDDIKRRDQYLRKQAA